MCCGEYRPAQSFKQMVRSGEIYLNISGMDPVISEQSISERLSSAIGMCEAVLEEKDMRLIGVVVAYIERALHSLPPTGAPQPSQN